MAQRPSVSNTKFVNEVFFISMTGTSICINFNDAEKLSTIPQDSRTTIANTQHQDDKRV